MAAWIGNGSQGAVMSGEGGHVTLPARDAAEESIIRKFRDWYGHCSAERVLSGPGIIDLHRAMHGQKIRTSEEITRNLDDPQCGATMQQFFSFLGSVAADLALITGAFWRPVYRRRHRSCVPGPDSRLTLSRALR